MAASREDGATRSSPSSYSSSAAFATSISTLAGGFMRRGLRPMDSRKRRESLSRSVSRRSLAASSFLRAARSVARAEGIESTTALRWIGRCRKNSTKGPCFAISLWFTGGSTFGGSPASIIFGPVPSRANCALFTFGRDSLRHTGVEACSVQLLLASRKGRLGEGGPPGNWRNASLAAPAFGPRPIDPVCTGRR